MIPKLIVGLGNPGPKYTETRHNAGFWFVERLADKRDASFRRETRFHGDTGLLRADGAECRLLKPGTFMNDSGRAVQAMLHFYGIAPGEMLVVHDEIDLPPGVARLKQGGGHGGHNGLRDIMQCVGGGGFARLRIGVGHPGSAEQVVGFVLDRPPAGERRLVEDAMERALEVMPLVFEGEWEKAMHRLHSGEG